MDIEVIAAGVTPTLIAMFVVLSMLDRPVRRKLTGDSDVDTVHKLRDGIRGWDPPTQKGE